MTRHAVPSQEFWTITPFSFETPDGWSARQTPTQLAHLSVDGEVGTNCGILWKRVPATWGLHDVSQMALGVIAAMDDRAKIGISKQGLLNGRPAYVRMAELTVGDGDEARLVGQYYTAFFGPRFGPDRPVELFEIVGHFEQGSESRLQEIVDIAASFRFDFGMRAVDEPVVDTA